jgi:hypothetical protein
MSQETIFYSPIRAHTIVAAAAACANAHVLREREREREREMGLERMTMRKRRRGSSPCAISTFSVFIIGQYMIEVNTSTEYP